MLQNRQEDMRTLASALRKELEDFEQLGINRDIDPEVFEPIHRRLNGTPLRAYFSQKMFLIIRDRLGWNKKLYHVLSNDESLFLVKLPFVFEMIITVQYLHNQVLDNKNGVNTSEKIANNLLTANILKDNLYEYLESAFPESIQLKLTKTVRHAFKLVDIGQLIEKKHNTYKSFTQPELLEEYHFSAQIDHFIDFTGMEDFITQLKKDLPKTYHDFTDLYLKRIFLTCAALFKLNTEFLCNTLGIRREEKARLLTFATTYGMMRQLINDNADFVPASHELSTVSKLPADAFSDLRNRNITLPLIYHLSESSGGSIAQWLAGSDKNLTAQEQQMFASILHTDHSLFKSIQLSRLLATIASSHLDKSTEAAWLLGDTCQIAWWNKFLAPVIKTDAYKKFKKTAYYKRMKKQMDGQISKKTLPLFNEVSETEKNTVFWRFTFNPK